MAEPRIKTTIEFLPEDYERLRAYADRQDIGLASAIIGLLDGKKGRTTFVPPSVDDVAAYLKEKGYTFDAESFVAYYATRGWRLNGKLMASWKAACLTWQKHTATPAEPKRDVQADDREAEAQRLAAIEIAEIERLRAQRRP